MSTPAATGSAVLWAVGRERSFGVPGAPADTLTAYKAILPLDSDLLAGESAGAAVNQSGWLERGIPGPKGGKSVWSLSLTTGSILDFLEHLLGRVTKTEPAPGVYRYLFEPSRTGVDTSFYALLSRSPVLRTWLYGIKLGKLSLAIGDNTEIPVKLEGLIAHGTRLSAPLPHPANTGTYPGPHLRGTLRNPAAGPVHVQVARVPPADIGLQFKTEQTASTPTFPGPAVDVALDASGQAIWQNLQGADGLDLGFWEENRDPLEIIWPGSASDHAALAPGDLFTFHPPGSWTDPAVPILTGHQRFTSAHWTLALRPLGSSTWSPMSCRKGTLELSWPISEERGNGSRYPYALLRDGLFAPSLKIERALVDPFFADQAEANARLEADLAFTGRQLTPTLRESLRFTFAAARIGTATRAIKDARAIPEEVTLVGETNDTLTPPITVEVITSRDWNPTL
ncbi:MAG TPA: hypothetical protein VN493_31020 [Thermoanaerobaculia bacterium]|nr:hypothetical protein [Thermoanaerobaculia bacterium]